MVAGLVLNTEQYQREANWLIQGHLDRAPNHCTSVQIDGEDAWKFVAGLAENIRASIIVSAAVAARSRSRFLQALEIQGKHAEAKFELSKICLMLWKFPPEESSPEMEW